VGIGNKAVDPGHFLKERDKSLSVELGEKIADDRGVAVVRRKLEFESFLVAIKEGLALGRGEIGDDLLEQITRQKVVDYDVWER